MKLKDAKKVTELGAKAPRKPPFRQKCSLRDRLNAHAVLAENARKEQSGLRASRGSTSDRYTDRASAGISHRSIICNLPVPAQGGQILILDSRLERDHALALMFNPGVRYIEEQVGFNWTEGGKTFTHYFDLLTLGHNGEAIGWSVRPKFRYDGSTLSQKLPKIAEYAVCTGQLDAVRLLTDQHINPTATDDALLILSVREDDEVAQEAVRAALTEAQAPVSYQDLIDRVQLGRRGRDAILRLLGLRVARLHSYGLSHGNALISLREGL
ncbi:hypothetical protein [Pseudogemmobacter faecipullorum]|uniref:Uncharacterized protein n=1 Tax=Pseudogemmobacter faecipullorum TaxID=2755041 RepID=A0ABS8CLN8_9RHOB|nr:hypothetical protein [Pseudogemmobacter faecipullorum]MCB5410297.1 hypothetical protein [Pseudogemmobacter faecipullorum]